MNACGLARRQKQQLSDSYLGFDTRKDYVICTNKVQRRKEIIRALSQLRGKERLLRYTVTPILELRSVRGEDIRER